MSDLILKDVSFSYPGGFLAVDHINMEIKSGENVAIVGQNGAGKTTTVKMMNGLLKPTEGDVLIGDMNTKNYTTAQVSRVVGYVFQNPDDQIFHATVESEVRYGPKTMKLDPAEEDRRVQEALEITGMEEFKDENPMNLPLSMRKFVTIAAVIAMGTEILIFDEPTAGQDVEGNKKLSEILKVLHGQGKTVITISHDMEFLNSVVNVIYHIEQAVLTRYTGDYHQFQAAYEVKKAQAAKAYERQQQEIERMEDFIQRNKARVATRGMANSRAKRLEKMEILEKPKEYIKPTFGFKEGRTPSRFIVEAFGLQLGYDEPLTRPVDFQIERNKKIAIRGVNGLGKTTLLKTILGLLKPVSGELVKGEFLQVGYFAQEDTPSNSETALDYIWNEYPAMTNAEVRAALARCGLTNEHITSQMRVLSGGENAKVRLCKLMQNKYNVLVLDEPTNHLDIYAKEELSRALRDFKGTIILVSHEPEFYQDWVTDIWNIEDWTTKIV